MPYNIIHGHENKIIKAWTNNVPFEPSARAQVLNLTYLDIIKHPIAIMPDVHHGIGATIGSVIPTVKAIIPAAVGVDIGCGMIAVQTDLDAKLLPDTLTKLRAAIEAAIPVGRTNQGKKNDRGAWHDIPASVLKRWEKLEPAYNKITTINPHAKSANNVNHLGTLGTGNHFIEICLDETDKMWFMLHSGSRGCGNKIGNYFIEQARLEMEKQNVKLPNKDLAYLTEGSKLYHHYIEAVSWAQEFAKANRADMMERLIITSRQYLPPFNILHEVINCHHNYVSFENYYGEALCITRKGAISAKLGEFGIIPGSMGAKSFIVKGKGNLESYCSSSHGAGRTLSRTEAKKRISLKDHIEDTKGVECRKDLAVLDESPKAYKNIDAVMLAQNDLIEIIHTLKQILCIKG